MTIEGDIERLLDHWFAERPTEVSERVLDGVADRIAREPQHPAWRLRDWRASPMTPSKIAASFAAVLVIAIVGVAVIRPGVSGVGGPSTALPSEPAPTTDGPPPSTLDYTWPGPLNAGTYTTRLIWDIPFELRFTVPDGWQARDVEVLRHELAVAFHRAGNTFADPCGRVAMDPPTGPTVDDLADALAALPEFDATEPIPVRAGDLADGRYLELEVRDDAVCRMPGMWEDPPDSYNGEGPVGPPWWAAEMPNMRMWILDVDGVRLVVSVLWSDSATPADLDELAAVVDSVRIVPATGPPVSLP